MLFRSRDHSHDRWSPTIGIGQLIVEFPRRDGRTLINLVKHQVDGFARDAVLADQALKQQDQRMASSGHIRQRAARDDDGGIGCP